MAAWFICAGISRRTPLPPGMTSRPVSPAANLWTKRIAKMPATDKILISRIDCLAVIGVTAEERALKQRLSIDVEFLIDCRKPGKSDSLKDAIDYAQVAAAVAQVCGKRPYHLIETVAELIAERVLSDF